MSDSGTKGMLQLDQVEVGVPLEAQPRENTASLSAEYPHAELGEKLESYLVSFAGSKASVELEQQGICSDNSRLVYIGSWNGEPVARLVAKSQRFELGGPYLYENHSVGEINTAIWIWVTFEVKPL